MKVYLDDLRPTPEGYDVRVYTAQGAVDVLLSGHVTTISLDNDLGEGDPHPGEGRDVASWIEAAAFNGTIPPCRILPVARDYMFQAIKNAYRYWGIS